MFSGADWFLLLINKIDAGTAARLLLILWRAWFVRNKVTHSGKWMPIMGSVTFLPRYWDTLQNIFFEGSTEGERAPHLIHSFNIWPLMTR